MPCKTRTQALYAVKEIVESFGGTGTLIPFESAEKLRKRMRETDFDAVLSSEIAVLSRVPRTVPTVYLSADFHCADKRLPSDFSAYWIAHEELSFECMTHGARDRNVHVCGVPLRKIYKAGIDAYSARRALGIETRQTVFSLYVDGVSQNEIKATVRAVRMLCPEARTLLWSGEQSRRTFWQSTFASEPTVYVPDAQEYIPLALGAADAVFCPAFASLVCAAARQKKIIILLHTAHVRARKNAAFLDERGVAFCGRTAADNVSFASRLLSSERLFSNMRRAHDKYIVPDAEARVSEYLRDVIGNR